MMAPRWSKITVLLLGALSSATASDRWPLWESYAASFINDDGRVMDHDAGDRTTSEGQSYALFFSLVANDRRRFDKLLAWTEHNLAHDSLRENLPAWLWENKQSSWQVTDWNSASDADLWLAYTLFEAGRLWHDARYTNTAEGLSELILERETAELPRLGPMLLPGPSGFQTKDGYFQLNASYLPVQLLLAEAEHQPDKPAWRQIAGNVPAVVKGSAPAGFVLDWIAYHPEQQFSVYPSPSPVPMASYDAVRVYLWAGMLPPSCPLRSKVISACWGMKDYLLGHPAPPAQVLPSGKIKDPRGGVGFSGAVLPFLSAVGATDSFERQSALVRSQFQPRTGLYGANPRYYDQNLLLFALGWCENRIGFKANGLLQVNWK